MTKLQTKLQKLKITPYRLAKLETNGKYNSKELKNAIGRISRYYKGAEFDNKQRLALLKSLDKLGVEIEDFIEASKYKLI